MLMIKIILYCTFIFNLSLCFPIESKENLTFNDDFNYTSFSYETKPTLTLDEFFDYTTFPFLSFSPTGQHLLYQTRRPSWNSNSFENSLWLYDIETQNTKLITKNFNQSVKPQWSPSGNWIALVLDQNSATNIANHLHYENQSSLEKPNVSEQYIHLYSVESDKFWHIQIGEQIPYGLTWPHNDSSIYFATHSTLAVEDSDKSEWKDVIHSSQQIQLHISVLYRIDIERENDTLWHKINIAKIVPFLISELLYVPSEEKLVLSTISTVTKNSDDFEIYSLDLRNLSSLTLLMNNTIEEKHLQLSTDNKNVLFTYDAASGIYMLNLTDRQIQLFGELFPGVIIGYTPRSDGGVYILGQWKTEIQIYSQESPTGKLVFHHGWNGTYQSIKSSSNPNCSIAFVWSSSNSPMEVYCADHIDNISLAKAITHENELFTQRNLPQTKVYNWTNKDDNQLIEGILHYPPGKFESQNLPLLVLIHGGPNSVSLNKLEGNYYDWAPQAASEGWLVLEPNYRGSTGYGSKFGSDLRRKPLTLAGRDILSGVDQLIKDGIADPYRLTVGGCSYGGSLTNWLITQTKRFNAALSHIGSVEHVSDWGATDGPDFFKRWFGGFPWEIPHIYQNEAPIYQLDRVRTPTLISTGENDLRTPAFQSHILARGLQSRQIPVQLIIFPNEGHSLNNNPWHGKIKVREELKWLKKYGEGGN